MRNSFKQLQSGADDREQEQEQEQGMNESKSRQTRAQVDKREQVRLTSRYGDYTNGSQALGQKTSECE